jgi:hypothetical protein
MTYKLYSSSNISHIFLILITLLLYSENNNKTKQKRKEIEKKHSLRYNVFFFNFIFIQK